MATDAYRHFRMYSFLRANTPQLLSVVGLSIGASLLEGLTLSLVVLVLQGDLAASIPRYPYPLDQLAAWYGTFALTTRLQLAALWLVTLTALKGVMLYSASRITSRLQVIVIRHFRMQCLDEMFKMGMRSFNRQKAADLQLVVDGYTESTAASIVGLIGTAMPQVFSASVLVGGLLFLSWKLTLASLVVVLVASVAISGVMRRISAASLITFGARSTFNRMLREVINGMKTIRLFHQEATVSRRFGSTVDRFNQAKFRADSLIGLVSPSFEFVGVSILAAVIGFGSWLVVSGDSSQFGVLLAFLVIMARVVTPVRALSQIRASIAEKLPALEALWQLLQPHGKEYPKNGSRRFTSLKTGIEFRDVDFAYDPGDRWILHGVSLAIPCGAKVGIVGPSGGGKSTLTELLLRFYDPQRGAIFIDGVDLRDLEIGSWRERIGVVSQDVFLFDDTVAANIAFARPGAREEEILEAARRAYADEFIRRMPEGYETLVGDRGVFLSTGQRQRISIARAVLSNPDILIFDEATSALDSESERYVQTALNELGQGRTVIVVAHRLSTITDSDEIVVMDGGRAIERGTHLDLIGRAGAYARLVKLQDVAGI